jgi:hypothetical protein
VDYGELTRRIAGRRTCSNCGRVFNLLTCPPGQAESETCPKTGGAHQLFQRPDDNEATVAERLKVYDEKTKPLIEFYREQGILRAIDAEGALDEVTERLEEALGGWGSSGGKKAAAVVKAAPRAKAAAKKTPGKKSAAKKAPVKKAPAKKSAVKKAPVKKAVAKKSAAKKAPGKKSPGKQAASKKAAAKKAAAKKGSRKGAKGRAKR